MIGVKERPLLKSPSDLNIKLCDNRHTTPNPSPSPALDPLKLTKDTDNNSSFSSSEPSQGSSLALPPSSSPQTNQVTSGILLSPSLETISVLSLASFSALSSFPMDFQTNNTNRSSLCPQEQEFVTDSSSRPQPTISFMVLLNGTFVMSHTALPLCQLCDHCTDRVHPIFQQQFTALLITNSCLQTDSSISSCSNSLLTLLPMLLDCCLDEFKDLPMFFSPTGVISVESWRYLSDEKIAEQWIVVEKICLEMKSIPGHHLSHPPLLTSLQISDLNASCMLLRNLSSVNSQVCVATL
jgi:hypothetical protein